MFHLSDFAISPDRQDHVLRHLALAMDLIWGYTGILSLGHGLFFALGGYAMGMYLMRQIGRDGNYKSDLPDFMVFLDWKTLPWHWAFRTASSPRWFMMVLVPGLLALVFGFFAFRSRIKGVYFSIITQAMTFAAMLLFFRNETGFGGNNGFTDFKRILGIPIATPSMRMAIVRADRAAHCWVSFCSRAGWCKASLAGCCKPSATQKAASCSRATTPAALQAHHLGDFCRDVRRGWSACTCRRWASSTPVK